MRVTYPGPYQAVTVLATGDVCEAGQSVDVPADVAVALIAQGWTKPTGPTKPKAGKAVPSKED